MTTVETVMQGFGSGSDQGRFGFCGVYLLREGARNILVDVSHVGRRALLLDRLDALGLTPADIDAVVLTHGHWDHCLNIDVFPNARIMLSAREHEYLRAPHPGDWATPVWINRIFEGHRVEELKDGDEIAAGARVMELPGHSKGSLGVVVDGPEGTIGLVGDAMPNAQTLAAGICYLVFWNEDDARRSVSKIVDTCTFVYPGHDRAFRIDKGGFRYIEKTSMSFFGLPEMPDGPLITSVAIGAPRQPEFVASGAESRAAAR